MSKKGVVKLGVIRNFGRDREVLSGGFRDAFKGVTGVALSSTNAQHQTWVVKTYKPNAIKAIENTMQILKIIPENKFKCILQLEKSLSVLLQKSPLTLEHVSSTTRCTTQFLMATQQPLKSS